MQDGLVRLRIEREEKNIGTHTEQRTRVGKQLKTCGTLFLRLIGWLQVLVEEGANVESSWEIIHPSMMDQRVAADWMTERSTRRLPAA